MSKNPAAGMRNPFCPALAALFLLLGSSACQRTCGPDAAHPNVATEAAAIQSVATEWLPEAQYLAEGRPAASTSEERRKLWVEDYATPGFSSDEATTTIEVARSGELAYQRGTYVSKAQNEQGTLTAATGKFLVVWRKQASGEWKVIIDIDNSDQ